MTTKILPTIRTFTVQDLNQIMNINKQCDLYPWSLGNFEQSLNAKHECMCLSINNKIVGFSVTKINRFESELLLISIKPSHQKQGHGKRLLLALIEKCKKMSEQLFLEVRESNLPAIGLYESCNFNCIGRRNGYYPAKGKREDALIFGLELHI